MDRVMIFTPFGPRLEPETVKAIEAIEWPGQLRIVFQNENPYTDWRENILYQYQLGRKRFMAGEDDAMLVIESDIIPPPDTLIKLAAIDADVAYGVYQFRNSPVINIFEKYPGTPRNEGESLSIHPDKLRAAIRRRITPMTGGGLGCALIHRHVLARFDFWHGETGACDTYFNRDVMRAGMRQMADMTVICGHKHENGTVIWPHFLKS